MADKKISQLTGASTPLAGTEVLPIVQSGSTVKVSAADVTAGRAVSALTYTSTATTGTAPFTVSSTTQVANLNAATAGTANNLKSNATTGVIQVAGPGAGTTRVMTTPDANFTAARTDAAQTFSGNQTYNNNVFIPSGVVHVGETTAGMYLDVYNGTADAQRVRITTSGTDGIVRATRSAGTTPNLLFQIDSTEYFKIGNTGNVTVNNGNLVVGTSGKGIFDSNSNEQLLFTTTASAVNEFTMKNAATGGLPQLAVTGGDTNIGMDLSAKGSGGFAFNGASRRFVRTGTNADTTVAATISFVSQTSDWISQLVEFRVALSSSAGSSVHGGVVRFLVSSLNSLATVTNLASDLTGVTAATSTSGMDFTVTFTITGGGNAIRYGIEADVLSSNGVGWYATGMSVA